MENHENNGHGNSHDASETEGNHQYYPRGWWVPLVGLVTVALGFTLLGSFIFSHFGTDRWEAKTEQCAENGKCCNDPNCKGDCKGEGKCEDKGECKDHKGGNAMSDSKVEGPGDTFSAVHAPMKDTMPAKPADHK